MQACSRPLGDGAPGSRLLPNEAGGTASPQKVSAERDVYVSQPRTPSATMTPRTRTLYAFGDTPNEKLQHINHQLNCDPGSDGAAMQALRQLSSTPQSRQAAVPAAVVGEKRAAEDKGVSRRNLHRRLHSQQGSSESGGSSQQ